MLFPVFTGIPLFMKKKNVQEFHCWNPSENNLKVRRRVGFRFIYYRVLSWLWGIKKKSFPPKPSWGLLETVKFCFLIHFRHMSVKVSVHFSFNFLKICVLEAAHNEEIKVIVILQLSAIFSHWFYVLADSMFNLLSRRGSCLC